MKNIELTEDHKSKLLEMCKILFPEYDFRINRPLFSNNESLSTIQLGKKSINIYEEEIHWFEFCMTYLAKKLIPKVTNYNLDDAYNSLYNIIYQFWENEHNHIIDYLYEKFKENEKN